MATHREGVNPLRPYYIPPTIGESPGHYGPCAFATGRNATNSSEYASKARDMLRELDYSHYLGDESPSMIQSVTNLIDELIWKYTSVLMSQPFEVAKMLLQVTSHSADEPADADLLHRRMASSPGCLEEVFWQNKGHMGRASIC